MSVNTKAWVGADVISAFPYETHLAEYTIVLVCGLCGHMLDKWKSRSATTLLPGGRQRQILLERLGLSGVHHPGGVAYYLDATGALVHQEEHDPTYEVNCPGCSSEFMDSMEFRTEDLAVAFLSAPRKGQDIIELAPDGSISIRRGRASNAAELSGWAG
jgi:hypothetical protein